MSKITDLEHARLLEYPQASKLFLGVQKGIDLLTAEVDGAHSAGATSILLRDVVLPTGDEDDLIRGMTVSLGLAEGADRRVSAVFLSYDSGTLTLEIGPNADTLADGTNVTVYSAFKLWKVAPPPFTEQKFPPFAICGSARAGFVNEPLSFVGEFAYSPIGRDLTAFQWRKYDADLVSGSLSAANTEDVPLVLSWDTAGEYLVRYKVTDDEGEVGIRFITVLIFERTGVNAPYSQVVLSNFRYGGAGWSADLSAYADADSDEFPRQGLGVVWAEDYYGFPVQDEQQSIGGQYRGASEVVFTGWIRTNSVLVSNEENSVTFTLDSAEVQMQGLSMPGRTFREGDDVTDWYTFADLTLDKALLHILQQETTLSLMCDVFVGLFAFPYGGPLDVPSAPLFDQLSQSILGAAFAYIAGSRFGSVTFARHRNMLTAAQRAYLNTASIEFSIRDWLDLKTNGDNQAGTAQVILEGRTGADLAVRGVYPATGPSRNGGIQTVSGQLFFDQAQADELAQVLWRADNRALKGATLRAPNYRILEPAFEEYATIILLSSQNTKGFNWDNELNGDTGREVICSGMSIDYADGGITVTYEFQISVYGAQGRSFDLLDPAPVLEFAYGYGQAAISPASDVDFLLDSEGEFLLDSEGYFLVDSL